MPAIGIAGTFADMLEVAQPGDYLFLWDKTPISYAIEEITEQTVRGHEERGPSHVASIWNFPQYWDELFETEAVFTPFCNGCRMLPLSHYALSKNRMLLCRRKGATEADIAQACGQALSALGRQYEIREEFQILLHKIAPWVRPEETDNKLFCSGYLQWDWRLTGVPFAPEKNGGNPTPMQCMLDARTEHVLWVN